MAPTLAMSVTGVQAARLLGRAAPLAHVLAGACMVLIGYGFVRLSAAFSHAGSVYAFIGRTLGPRAGFFATWMLIGTYIVFPPVSVLGMAAFTQAFLRHAGIHDRSSQLSRSAHFSTWSASAARCSGSAPTQPASPNSLTQPLRSVTSPPATSGAQWPTPSTSPLS
jgi:amino acid transporter